MKMLKGHEYSVIKTANGQTGYISLGSGQPLVMLVGYSGNLLHWNSELVYHLAQKYTVFLPDNRKVGLTDSHNPATIEGMALDTLDFIKALKLEHPIIVGWSMGGIIAQALAYEHSSQLSGLALIVSQPDYSFTHGRLHQLVTNLRNKPGKENRDKLTELFFSEMPSVEFRKYLAKTILAIPEYVYPFNKVAQDFQDHAIGNWRMNTDKLSQIKLPVLITCAKNDQVTDPKASMFIHDKLSNSKLISYYTGGHFFLHYFPKNLADEIINFFNNV